MDGKLRSKEAFVASGFGSTFVDGNIAYRSALVTLNKTFSYLRHLEILPPRQSGRSHLDCIDFRRRADIARSSVNVTPQEPVL